MLPVRKISAIFRTGKPLWTPNFIGKHASYAEHTVTHDLSHTLPVPLLLAVRFS
jgi:hypothetical protein